MKKILFFIVFLSCCMVGITDAKTDAKKETKAQRIARLEQENASLRSNVDSLSTVSNIKDVQIRQLETKADSLTSENQQLKKENQTMAEQIKKTVKEEEEKEKYLKNKEYYITAERQLCEKRKLCKDWAEAMAKKSGKDFKVVDIVENKTSNTEYWESEEFLRYEYDYGSDIPIPITRTVKSYRHDDITSVVKVNYSVNNSVFSKTFTCTMRKVHDKVEKPETCKWTMKIETD